MASTALQDTTTPPTKLPNVSGVVTIEAPPYKEGTEDTAKPKLDLKAPSIRDVSQAWNLCKSTESANKFRSERATAMELEYSGQPPFSAAGKIETAQSWQSNVCTGVLQGITDRKVLKFTRAITKQVYLTHSSLPVTWDQWKKKSDCFCAHTTKMIQGWGDYAVFINSLCKEVVLHGYGYTVFLDPMTWKPRFFKQDVAYVPDESSQDSRNLQFFVIKHDYLLHEFIELFQDEEAAKDLGYDLTNCINAAAASEVKNPREDMVTTEYRKFAEFIEDGIMGLTYASSGPRVVKTYLLWNREYDGKVSFWILSRDNGKQLRMSEKLFKGMQEVTQLFSFQPGNGSLHSSKGLGRMLIGNVKITEKLRNKMVDNVIMSSMLILQAPTKDRNTLQPVVHSPFIVVDSSIQVSKSQFAIDPAMLAALDERMNNYIAQAGGAFITDNQDANEKSQTATEASIDFKRERESEDITEGRFMDQFYRLCGIMQVRAFSDEHIDEAKKLFDSIAAGEQETEEFYDDVSGDKDAVRTLVQMLKDNLEPDEIKILRRAPPSGYADTNAIVTSQGVLAVKKVMTNNPNIDQAKMDERVVEVLGGPELARDIVIPNVDQTVSAEAIRMQMQECVAMAQMLMPSPVSPRDNHLIHGKVVMTVLGGLGQKISDLSTGDLTMKQAELNLNHLGEHLAAYLQHGGVTQNPDYKELNDFYNTFKQQFVQAVSIHEHARAAAQATSPEHAKAIMGQATNTPVPKAGSGSNISPGAVSEGAPMASPEQFPESGADLEFNGGEKGVAPVLPAV